MANKTVTVKASGGDYTSLNAALAGENALIANLVANTCVLTIECYDLGTDDGPADTGSGWTTSASYYINIVAPAGQRHDGKWNTSKYRILMSGDSASLGGFTNRADYTRLTGIQIKRSTTGSFQNLYGIYNVSNNLLVDSCIIWLKVDHGSGLGRGINTGSFIHEIRNTVIFANGSVGGGVSGFYGVVANGTAYYWDNVTVSGFDIGLSMAFGAPAQVRNCLVQGAVTAGYADTSSTTTGSVTNLSNLADAPGSSPQNSKSVTFVDAANGDFHLAVGDTNAIDKGTDLSSSFTKDIDDVVRTGTWDLGADEYVASGGGGGGGGSRNRSACIM